MNMIFVIYSGSKNTLVPIDKTGILLDIAPNNGYPFVFSSISADSGTSTDIIISYNEAKVMPKPYSECVDINTYSSPMIPLLKQMDINYTREYCLNVYTQYMINQKLNCYDYT